MAEDGDGGAAARTKRAAARKKPAAARKKPAAARKKPSGRTNLVYWDIEKCPIPEEYKDKANEIYEDLKKKLSAWGFQGPVKMRASHYNNYAKISPSTSKELSDSGIIVEHIKHEPLGDGEDYPSYPMVMFDLRDWIKKSPPPANILFITVDRPFDAPYKKLREEKYNILRIRPGRMDSIRDDDDYCSWSWSDIFHGGRPLIASVCYDDEWTWSETCKDGKTMLAELLAEQSGGERALCPRRNGKSLSNGDDPRRSGGNGGTTFGALYTWKNMKLLRNGGEPAGLTGRLRPRRNMESPSDGGEPSEPSESPIG